MDVDLKSFQRPKFPWSKILWWKLGGYREKGIDRHPPLDFKYPNPLEMVSDLLPKVTWIGHSTFLIQYSDLNLLFDPIWSQRSSPFSWIGPKRYTQPGLNLCNLPRIDAVFLSHNHYDHCDKTTLQYLAYAFPACQWFVPTGMGDFIKKISASPLHELGWWAKRPLLLKGQVTCVPAKHISGRSLKDFNRSLCAGWVVEVGSKTLYFVGDTAYHPFYFKEVEALGLNIDLSLIPIGAYSPRQLMQSVHVNSEEAVQIHLDVKSQLSIGMHWNTFKLTDEHTQMPPYDLYQALRKKEIDPAKFRVLKIGQTINW
jgi:N-acyl-phosphatidylethanolamine-hydrolysing phospholipase D